MVATVVGTVIVLAEVGIVMMINSTSYFFSSVVRVERIVLFRRSAWLRWDHPRSTMVRLLVIGRANDWDHVYFTRA